MEMLNAIAAFAQNGLAQITAIDHLWLLLGFFVLVLALIIFTLEKSKAVLWILVLYALGFIAMQIDQIPTVQYESYIVGALPILALLVLKFKRKKH